MNYPSYFSRLYETADAFRNVTEGLRNGIHYRADKENLIVEKCLDIINLLYLPDERIRIVTMGLNEINKQQYTEPGDKRLMDVILEDAKPLFNFASDEKIGVILKEGRVIGGISPFTLVYSNPDNDKDSISVLEAISNKSQEMGNLMSRDYSFIQYLFTLAINGLLPEILREYVMESLRVHPNIRVKLESDLLDLQGLREMTDTNGVVVKVKGCHLYRNSEEAMVVGSGYMIRSAKISLYDGSVKLPLVLSQSGIPNASYIGNICWNRNFQFDFNYAPIDERLLPMTGIRYPYLTVDDFLEERIIECESVHGSISRLYLYMVGDTHYVMLPLRRTFFEYFTVEDIDRFLEIDYSNGCYHVKLSIPVQAGIIEFHKTYYQESIIVLNLDREFNMAVTPFLNTEDLPRRVITMQNHCECIIRFINSENNTEIVPSTMHSEDGFEYRSIKLVFAKTVQHWDCMTLEIRKNMNEEANGILVPMFGKTCQGLCDDYRFSILVNDRFASILQTNIMSGITEPLVINRDSGLVRAMANTSMFDFILRQCFIFIGDESSPNMSLTRIPLSVNSSRSTDSVEMLGGCNIALDSSEPIPYHMKQISNLFVHVCNKSYQKDKMIFCEEIAYLIRFSCIEKGLRQFPKIRVEVPLWLNQADKACYRSIWESAFKGVGLPTSNMEFVDSNATLFSHLRNFFPPQRKIFHVNIDAYHTIFACHNGLTDSIEYEIQDFGINNLYGLVDDFKSLQDNAYIRRIVGSGQRDSKLMTMVDQHRDSLDILERAIEIKDYSCIEISDFLAPYALFVGVLAEAIIDFAMSSGLENQLEVIISGNGLRFLSGISGEICLSDNIKSIIIDLLQNTREDIDMRDIQIVQENDYNLYPYFDYNENPQMIKTPEDKIQIERLNQIEMHDFMNATWKDILVEINNVIDFEWVDCILRKSGITSKEKLIIILQRSYEHCLFDYMEICRINNQTNFPDMRFWPYVYSLSSLALEGYKRQSPFNADSEFR